MIQPKTGKTKQAPRRSKTAAASASAIPRMPVARWVQLQQSVHDLLIAEEADGFVANLDAIHAEIGQQMHHHADATLTTLIYLGATEINLYSATHSVLVSAVCALVARQTLAWPASDCDAVAKAALSMNIEMTALQDHLARQSQRPSAEQQRLIDLHCVLGADLLAEFGVKDKLWLDAVRHHHDKTPGPLAAREPFSRLARLIERVDVYAARMAPREGRSPLPPEMAMSSCRLDENSQVDEAGQAVIDTLGKYPPGSTVRLSNGESGIVVGRSRGAQAPKVVALIDANGKALPSPTLRHTGLKQFRVLQSTAHASLGSAANLEKVLRLI